MVSRELLFTQLHCLHQHIRFRPVQAERAEILLAHRKTKTLKDERANKFLVRADAFTFFLNALWNIFIYL